MATITLTYKPKKKPTPVVDQIVEDSETSSNCISEMNITVTPVGTKYLEVIEVSNGGSSVYSSVVDGNISTVTNVDMFIDAYKSYSSSQNIYSSSITLRVRTTIGGAIEDSITMYRDHTSNIC